MRLLSSLVHLTDVFLQHRDGDPGALLQDEAGHSASGGPHGGPMSLRLLSAAESLFLQLKVCNPMFELCT